jgi:hypothetical protein
MLDLPDTPRRVYRAPVPAYRSSGPSCPPLPARGRGVGEMERESSSVGLALAVGLGAVLSAVVCGAQPVTDTQRNCSYRN